MAVTISLKFKLQNPNSMSNQAANFLRQTRNSLKRDSGTYPHTREQIIEELSEFKKKGVVDIDRSTIEAYIHWAGDEYSKAFNEKRNFDTAWWDGALAMARWILDADGQ